MGRKVQYENYRVEVEPEQPYMGTVDHRRMLEECETLRKEIRRHVDGIRSASVNYDDASVCEFCGRPWTEGQSNRHNGGCCDEDTANMPEENQASNL